MTPKSVLISSTTKTTLMSSTTLTTLSNNIQNISWNQTSPSPSLTHFNYSSSYFDVNDFKTVLLLVHV